MMELLSDLSTWSILKWVVIVLVAGFIGQFGKTLAQAVIGRIRRKKTLKDLPAGIEVPSAMPIEKTEAAPGRLIQNPPLPPRDVTGIPDKKTLKTLAKQQKKAEKQSGKN